MARLVEWHDDYARAAECVRFRSAVRRRRLREWLRRIPCRCQRPVLVSPANEETLVAPVALVQTAARSKLWRLTLGSDVGFALWKNRRLVSTEVISVVAGVPPAS